MTIGSSIIFVRVSHAPPIEKDLLKRNQTKATANEIETRMNREGHAVALLTGELQPADRDIIIDSFRKGEAKVLITTNVLSRK